MLFHDSLDPGESATCEQVDGAGWRTVLGLVLVVTVLAGLLILVMGVVPASGAAGGCGGG